MLFNETNKFEKLRIEYTSILKQTFAEHKDIIKKKLTALANQYKDREMESPAKYLIPRPGQFEKQNFSLKNRGNYSDE